MRNKPLTDDEKDQIKALRQANPKMRYRQIGALFGVTASAVCTVLSGRYEPTPQRRAREPHPHSLPPDPKPAPIQRKAEPTDFVSIIRPIPVEQKMAGNGRYARPIPA